MWQATTFDPARDHSATAQLGFPCLQHVSFVPTKAGLVANAFYATQQLFDKAYGNYLGLAQLAAFMAGDLDVLVVSGGTAQPVHRDGRGRLIAWTSARRITSTPDVPSIAEFAPGLDVLSWFGLLAPARTPADMVQRVNSAANEALKDERIRERLITEGQFLAGGSPEDFAGFLSRSDTQWRPILSKLNVPRN
jgi:tripartite-type tricarboxylate transporter receptor subunit TctC